ncbi:tRNA dimethylallyltransferase 2 isoform X2 [Brassica rapa]|uniref:tRNA dimethylallyltransferase 2 isoform X2 n=1 Tax=Brassica campestris TaxID=3711 RepID=UPI00142E6A36|nr:tRNA dimethylallyltransferase 2 isoform X2 [Brassica rapa]
MGLLTKLKSVNRNLFMILLLIRFTSQTESVSAMSLNPSNGGIDEAKMKKKAKVVVIMGPTGSGKSKLAVDLASHFPVEIINADAMQIYSGLDVLTNKVTVNEQKDLEFTAKDFRDSTIPLIEEILSRNHVPVLVGGTNYYIQALVSKFLLEDSTEDVDECCSNVAPGLDVESISGRDDLSHGYDLLKELDPVAANRVHPNNHRKINQYLSLHASRGVLPSKLYQENAAENWGCIDASSRFDYCLICMDAETTVLDEYVGQRVDSMVDAGLLDEVYDIYKPGADYTRGLRQSIGVREFENFLKTYLPDTNSSANDKALKENLRKILDSPKDDKLRVMLEEAIDSVKLNTRRLLRRQKRRINRLETVFGWNIHHVDATECLLGKSEESWDVQVVKPATQILQSFLKTETELSHDSTLRKSMERDLWSQYVCEVCGNKVLRGRHEWDHHTQGRVHRKRTARFKKAQNFENREKQEEEEVGICRETS